MSGDWQRKPQLNQSQSPNPQDTPFMRTSFGYSSPETYRATQQTPSSRSQMPVLPQLQQPAPQGYDVEHINTPTSTLLPSNQVTQQVRGRLLTTKGEQRGESWFLNRNRTSLGRALDNDIVLLDIASSRKHAQIIRGEHGFTLIDLKSANGVYLNGRRITEEELYDDDEIEIGETVLKFETVGQPRSRMNYHEDDTDPEMNALPSSNPYLAPIEATPQPQYNQQASYQPPLNASQQNLGVQVHRQRSFTQPQVNHLTYGFGSQLSPEELNLLTQTPSSDLNTHLDRFSNLYKQLKLEVRLGQGPRAQALRLSILLTLILSFFVLGKGLKSLINQAPNTLETSENELNSENTVELVNQQTLIQNQQIEVLIQSTSQLMKQGSWRQALNSINQKDMYPSSQQNPRVKSLRTEIERQLINQEEGPIRENLRRGTLAKAKSLFNTLNQSLSPEAQEKLIPLAYALWLHERELGELDSINPPPREQQALSRSAENFEKGQFKSAQQALRRVRPHKQRVALFNLRKQAIEFAFQSSQNQTQDEQLKQLEFKAILGTSLNSQYLLMLYKASIEQAVIKTKYKEIAPWLEGAIILALNQPQRQYFIDKQSKLKNEALKWFNIATSSNSSNSRSLKKALLDSALPYLDSDKKDQARLLLKRLH